MKILSFLIIPDKAERKYEARVAYGEGAIETILFLSLLSRNYEPSMLAMTHIFKSFNRPLFFPKQERVCK